MPRELPPCYAMVMPGIEEVAAEEIERRLGAEVKRTERGVVVFRADEVDRRLLELRTTEDVFLFAWGTDKLSYRATDLDSIARWTAREPNWEALLRLHHAIRPKPKGRPTYRIVTQMSGTHGYRRVDARDALARGLAGKFPASWRHAEENAAVEVWLTIQGATAVCGLRLSDRSMRHRTYKIDHTPASLRPTVAAAMVWLAEARPGQLVVDPMCGAGTILAEQLAVGYDRERGKVRVAGGDLDQGSLRACGTNLRRLGSAVLARWDAARLPLPDASVHCIVSNPPFGKQLGTPEEIGPLFNAVIPEYHRVLRPGGRAVLLVGDLGPLRDAVRTVGWKSLRQLRVRVLGQQAALTVWRKPGPSATMQPVAALST